MKREYKKPYLLVESFQLNAAIAGSCTTLGGITINYGEDNCGYKMIAPGMYQFFNYYNCEMDLTGPGGDGNDTICYHGPSESNGRVFISS